MLRKALIVLLIFSETLFSQVPDDGYKTKTDILYYENGSEDSYLNERCRLDVYYPENIKDFSTIVWFHGGGLKAGEKYIPVVLKNQNVAVVAVNYRFYPTVKAPVYIEDAAASVAWVFKHIKEFGGDASKIFVSGHSAGGYLASMIGLDKSYLENFNIDADSIAGLIPFSGHTITHFTVREEMGIPGEQPIVDKYAPLYHVKKNSPPLLLITGDREMELLGRYEENAYMWRMMKVAGNEVTQLSELEGFDHGGMVDPACFLLLDFVRDIAKK